MPDFKEDLIERISTSLLSVFRFVSSMLGVRELRKRVSELFKEFIVTQKTLRESMQKLTQLR